MSKAQAQTTPEEIVAGALNEQGYLFQHKLATTLLADEANQAKHSWQLEAAEVPVSFRDYETRIDLVLRLGPESQVPVRAVIECKRSMRDFKRWVFFAQNEIVQTASPKFYYAEHSHLQGAWNGQGEPNIVHTIDPKPALTECPVFDFGVEAKLSSSGGDKRVSATDAIEDAFQQVTLGQAGLGVKLRQLHVLNFLNLPIVVTTAELVSAHFDAHHVSMDRGTIEAKNLKLESREWLAVNFRIRQTITLSVPTGLHSKISLGADLALRQIRTVFVVQAEHMQKFLAWLEKVFPTATG